MKVLVFSVNCGWDLFIAYKLRFGHKSGSKNCNFLTPLTFLWPIYIWKWTFGTFSYLFVITVFCLVVKYIKPRSCIETRMVIPSFYDWCYIMSIGESCQSVISYVDGMLCNTLPIRVLIDCEKNKTKNQPVCLTFARNWESFYAKAGSCMKVLLCILTS